MTNAPSDFIVTHEHRRFAEFCDACRRSRYIGLCYGAAGVGKTVSARCYANAALLETWLSSHSMLIPDGAAVPDRATVFYTPQVVNTPRHVEHGIETQRHQLRMLAVEAWLENQRHLYQVRKRDEALLRPRRLQSPTRSNGNVIQIYEAATRPGTDISKTYAEMRATMPDPTDLIIIDEADRLKTASLEQVRDIFDHSHLGIVLIGMPGLEKRLSRYPQLYSRVGFVHAFRPLRAAQVRDLLQQKWVPSGVVLPEEGVADEEALAAIIRVTGGNFRLLHRLLTQVARIMEINALQSVTSEVVEAARESLVIGTV
jgi:DNA transposition AAA+ family ATPase